MKRAPGAYDRNKIVHKTALRYKCIASDREEIFLKNTEVLSYCCISKLFTHKRIYVEYIKR